MSMTNPGSTRTHERGAAVRGRTMGAMTRRGGHEEQETKPSFLTTELWLTIAGIAAMIVVYNVSDDPSIDLWNTCLLIAIGASAYVVSRGLAKAGARHDHRVDAGARDEY